MEFELWHEEMAYNESIHDECPECGATLIDSDCPCWEEEECC